MWYVSILGPYDSCYVGPFSESLAAESFAVWLKHINVNMDAWRVSEQEFMANLAEYGPIDLYAPSEYRAGAGAAAWPGYRDAALN